MSGCTWNSRNALRKMVAARRGMDVRAPQRPGYRTARRAASSVLERSMATVIGPRRRDRGLSPKRARRPDRIRRPPPLAGLVAVLPDVDDHRPRLDPVAADHLGPPDGGHDEVGAPHLLGQILRLGVADVTVASAAAA